MKYSTTIVINQPIDKVCKLYDSEENLYKWMKGLEKIEHIEGEKGKVGAKSNLYFKMGKREMVMLETIKAMNLPEEFTAEYEAKGVFNIVKTSFEKIDDNTTKCITEHEFQFKGMMKIIAFLMPGAFKKQSKKYMEDFKAFAESE